VFEGKR
jgi:hypothetical protein